MMAIVSFANPRYSAPGNGMIDIDAVIDGLGPDPVPFTATPDMDVFQRCLAGEAGEIRPYPTPTLDDERAAKIAAIVEASEALLTAGAPVDGDLHIALDDGSRADLTAMAATATAAAGGAVPWPESYSRGWISIENIRIPLASPADGLALAASVGNHYAAIVQNRRDLKDAALAATDEAGLDAIDVTTGWPG